MLSWELASQGDELMGCRGKFLQFFCLAALFSQEGQVKHGLVPFPVRDRSGEAGAGTARFSFSQSLTSSIDCSPSLARPETGTL